MSPDEAAPGDPEARPPRGAMTRRLSLVGTATLGVAVFACGQGPAHASAQSVRGRVVDDRTDAAVPNALVQLGLTEHYGVTDGDGLCPPDSAPPGTIKRGRRVGRST